MRIENLTQWDTKLVARLIRRVAEDELDKGQLKHARVTLKYKRKFGILGCCTLGTSRNPRVYMTLMLPRPGVPVDSVMLALVIAHELGHAKGLRHRQMKNPRYGFVGDWQDRYAYARAFLIAPIPSREANLTKQRRRRN